MNNLGFTEEEMKLINKTTWTTEEEKIINNNRKLKLVFNICRRREISIFPRFLINSVDFKTKYAQADAGQIETWELQLIEKEEIGGNCDVCDKPWKKIDVKIFDDKKDKNEKVIEPAWIISHYQPACICYPRCLRCNRWLIREVKKRQTGCQYCGKKGIYCWKKGNIENEDGTKQRGRGKVCTGVLRLQPTPENGYTVFKCDKCDNTLKRKIIV